MSVLSLLGAALMGCPAKVTTGTGGGGTGAGGNGSTDGGGGSGGAACVPGTEICDTKDNDCDGVVDNVPGLPNGCLCEEGTSQSCYSGPEGTDGVGVCHAGTQDCEGGTWGTCNGEVTPEEEVCNLMDDDCNMIVDDGMAPLTCGVGACEVTTEACVDGVAQTCVPGMPGQEVCDGIDNNCNQLVDESDPDQNKPCMTGQPGACSGGLFKCQDGALVCEGLAPSTEVCDGVDNDCNGAVDDLPGTGGVCTTGLPGVCSEGIISCQFANGMFQVDCFPIVAPSNDVCDGLDNNCNGTADEMDPGGGGTCMTGTPGICGPGVIHCLGGALQCVPNAAAQSETCNGQDDDCDGVADDGNPGGGLGCNTGLPGICQTGTTNCISGGVQCTQTVMPTAELCNGQDDNCNGLVDDGNPGGGAACNTGLLGVCGPGTITCTGGSLQCVQNTASSPEVCGNAIDENCDGNAPAAPTAYFNETFANNSQGWTVGTDWAIGPAVASACASPTTGNDPGTDHTPTADNGVAGVILGGCYPTTLHGDYCITSPNIDLSVAPGAVYLSYWRHLHTDYPSFITSKVDVSSNGGSTWTTVYSVPSGQFQNDAAWTRPTFNVTAQKSATFRVRFCYAAGSSGIITGGGWNVDDVQLTDTICN